MCTCEAPSAFVVIVRTARKNHHCCECHMPIRKGRRYQYVSGVWDGRGRSFKTCMSCATIRDLEAKSSREHGDCGPCFEELIDHLNDKYYNVDQVFLKGVHDKIIFA